MSLSQYIQLLLLLAIFEIPSLTPLSLFDLAPLIAMIYFERGTSSKTSSFAGVAGGSFTLIGSVGSWKSEFKVVTFS